MSVPKLRFPEFRDAGQWEIKEFSEYIVLYRGSSPRPIQNYFSSDNSGVNWIKIGDTKYAKNFIISQVDERITPEGAEKSRRVNIGELILANSMSYGKTYQIAIDGYIYDGWFVLRDYEKHFNKKFLLQLLNSEYMQNQYERFSAGGIVQNISSDIVYKTVLPRTSLKEQQKIADCLSSIDDRITAETQKLDTLKVHKKGLMQQLFPAEGETLPKLRFPEFQDDWKEGNIGNLATTVMGNAFKSSDFVESGIQLMRMGNLYQGELQLNRMPVYLPSFFEEEYVNFLINPLDLLMSMTGTAGKRDYGFIIQIPKDCKPLLLNQRVMKISPKANCAKQFLLQILKNEGLLSKLYSSAGGTKQANLSAQQLKDLEITFPHEAEQKKIADCLSSLDDLITAQTQKIDTLKTHKKGLMQQLFPALDEVKQ